MDSRLNKFDVNYQKCSERVHAFSRKRARYQHSLKGRITIAKTFMLPQFTYIASVLDPTTSTYDEINRIIGLFINTGTTKPITKTNWIHKDILYGPKSEGGLSFIDARGCRFFHLQEEGKRETSHKLSGLWTLQDRIQTPKSPGPFGRKRHQSIE